MEQSVILVIDDDKRWQEEIEEGLGLYGFETILVPDRAAAEKILTETPVDFILLDLMLADGDHGLKVLQALGGRQLLTSKRNPAIQGSIPVFVMTITEQPSTLVMSCLNAGAIGYERKPFDYGVLAARIRAILKYIDRPTGATKVTDFTFASRGRQWTLNTAHRSLYAQEGNGPSAEVSIGANEFNILYEFLQNPQTLVDHRRLGDLLHSPDQLKKRIRNLRQIFEEDPAHPKLIIVVQSQGYQFTGEVVASPG